MSDSIVQATVRLTILGDGGRVDVAVPLWTDIATLVSMYVDRTQCGPVSLHTAAGRPLPTDATVQGSRLVHGDVLVGISGTGLPGRRVRGHDGEGEPADSTSPSSPVAFLAPLSAATLGLAAATTGLIDGGTARDAAVLGLLIVSLLAVLLARGQRAVDTGWLAVVPLLTASAAAIAASSTLGPSDDHRLLLVAAVGGLVSATAAGAVRAGHPGVADDWMLGWLVTGIVVALSAALCLLADWSTATFWVFLVVAAVLAARVVPSYVVDVPDHVLLDFARLAVTAWTAREQPRRAFRGVIRRDDVEAVARRALRLVGAGSVFAAVASVVATTALLLPDEGPSRRIGIVILSLGAGAALSLGGRTLRVQMARHVQRTAGTLILVATAASVLAELDVSSRPAFAAAAIALGALLVVVARSAGRGWTSVRWSRTAEICETLASILVFGSLPLATGLFDWVRALTSS
jgi:hypothetical protein